MNQPLLKQLVKKNTMIDNILYCDFVMEIGKSVTFIPLLLKICGLAELPK
jgi:hypothetical protein